jgi:hypothetical protein
MWESGNQAILDLPIGNGQWNGNFKWSIGHCRSIED